MNNGKCALVTGASGQDGSYLVEFLLEKGYEVHALIRQTTQFTPDRWGYLRTAMKNGLKLQYGDLLDGNRLQTILETIKPDEVYNLAAQSHVGLSFSQPENTCQVTGMGALRLLEAVRHVKERGIVNPKFYQASSSEMFGRVRETPQNELTPFYPRSPYGCAKAFAHYATQNYREAYGIFAVSGILFNHESERRGEGFVTRKITRAIGRIIAGTQDCLQLGDVSAKRDWGYAPDYIEAIWLMMQQETPRDIIIGTGVTRTVRDFVNAAFECAGLNVDKYLKIDETLIRPTEVDTLCADISLAKSVLNWKPQTTFDGMVEKMVNHDILLAEKEND